MGMSVQLHELSWRLSLDENGWSCWTLADAEGNRWGYAVNTGGWLAHLGAFGANPLPLEIPPTLRPTATAAAAKSWVEEQISDLWERHIHAQKAAEPPAAA